MQNNKQNSHSAMLFAGFAFLFYQAENILASIRLFWQNTKRSIDFSYSRLNNLQSDVSAYLADLNLVNSEDTGLVLSLPGQNKISNNLSVTLPGDSLAYTQTTVANLMLVGAGRKRFCTFFGAPTGAQVVIMSVCPWQNALSPKLLLLLHNNSART